jgi:hypothetical protein
MTNSYYTNFKNYCYKSITQSLYSLKKMNIQQRAQEVSLHVPPLMWRHFRRAMLNARSDREEVIGFFFCKRHQRSKRQIRYTPIAWVVPSPDCYESQSDSGLVLKQKFHEYLLETYLLNSKLDVVHIHTHSGLELPSFSYVDDRHEAEYAKFLSSSCKHKPRLISGVFDESLSRSQFRIWDRKGRSVNPIKFHHSWFEPASTEASLSTQERELIFARQKIFGETVQDRLSQLTVALIGCGGIGAVFAEQLARLGVKKWVLIDPDRLEAVNLNRMPAATEEMVEQWWYKVHYVKWLIKRMYATGSHVKAMPISIEDKAAQQEIASADLIVVATDNHLSRQVAQELALEYVCPLVCLGTHIEVKADSVPRMYCRVTVPPLGGSWCLMCGNIISLQKAALESAPMEIIDLAKGADYIDGIEDPAVFWLNSICASTGVGVIHGMVSGFLDLDSGLDWIYDFPNSNWLKTNTESLTTPDCYFCSKQ